MTTLTRRGALGLLGGAAGLAGCASDAAAKPSVFAGRAAFLHGVASGDPLQTAFVIWTRASLAEGTGPVMVGWNVFGVDDAERPVRSGTVVTDATRDHTVKVDVIGLEPGTVYAYRFRLTDASGEVLSPTGRARTLDAGGTRPVKAAVVSCSNYPFGLFNVYDAIAQEDGLDVVIHLGDYLYEYGPDGYGGPTGDALGRAHEPASEIVSLADYRTRHAQYKSDPSLQKAHAAAPWICTWDDHESTNNAYRTGAENHDPGEGDWTERKQRAVQAYLEWMPVRDPAPGMARAALWRSFDFGNVATVTCLETRLTGRSEEISWGAELDGVAPEAMRGKIADVLARVNDPARTMLGTEQEDWLGRELAGSVSRGKAWQVLANQIIMAEVRPPNFRETLSEDQIAALPEGLIRRLVDFSALGVPFNLDAWDGFPACRERVYAMARDAGATLVTLTGDTHTGWANRLLDAAGNDRGAEFGCTSVTSPGLGTYMPGIEDLGAQFAAANPQVAWHDPFGNGYTLVTFAADTVTAEFRKVSTIVEPDYLTETAARFAFTKEVGLQAV